MKDTDHPPVHVFIHLLVNGSYAEDSGCAVRDSEFGRGQKLRLGWSDPTYVATETVAVAPAQPSA